MKRALIWVLGALLVATALDQVPTFLAKADSAGQITTGLIDEGGNVLNQTMAEVQDVGTPPVDTTPTTAPAVGDGRP